MATTLVRIIQRIGAATGLMSSQIGIDDVVDTDTGQKLSHYKDEDGTVHKNANINENVVFNDIQVDGDISGDFIDDVIDDVATNAADIANNVTNISQNSSDVSSNATAISTLNEYNSERADATLEYSGFTNNKNIVESYDSTSRTITLTGTFKMYYLGVEILNVTTSWESSAHAAGPTSTLFLKYNGGGFSWSTTPWNFNETQIAYVCFKSDGTFCFAQREVHGFMPWQTHLEFHKTVGTYKDSGGDITGYTLDSSTATDRRPQISATTLYDEDLKTVVAAHTTQDDYSFMYLSGTTGVPTITKGDAEIVDLNSGIPVVNPFAGGTFGTEDLVNGDAANVWIICIPTTSDTVSQQARFIFLAPQVQWSSTNQANTVALAALENPQELNFGDFGDLSPEFTMIGRICLYRNGPSTWVVADVEELDITKASIVRTASGYLSSVSTDSSLDGNGTSGNVLGVHTALALGEKLEFTQAAHAGSTDNFAVDYRDVFELATFSNSDTNREIAVNEKYVAVCESDGTSELVLYGRSDMAEITRIARAVGSIAFLPDGSFIVANATGVERYSVPDLAEIATVTESSNGHYDSSVDAANSQIAVPAGGGTSLKIFDYDLALLGTHSYASVLVNQICALMFSADGDTLYVLDAPYAAAGAVTLRILDVSTIDTPTETGSVSLTTSVNGETNANIGFYNGDIAVVYTKGGVLSVAAVDIVDISTPESPSVSFEGAVTAYGSFGRHVGDGLVWRTLPNTIAVSQMPALTTVVSDFEDRRGGGGVASTPEVVNADGTPFVWTKQDEALTIKERLEGGRLIESRETVTSMSVTKYDRNNIIEVPDTRTESVYISIDADVLAEKGFRFGVYVQYNGYNTALSVGGYVYDCNKIADDGHWIFWFTVLNGRPVPEASPTFVPS